MKLAIKYILFFGGFGILYILTGSMASLKGVDSYYTYKTGFISGAIFAVSYDWFFGMFKKEKDEDINDNITKPVN